MTGESRLTHLDPAGRPRMVDVTPKGETVREATAAGQVSMRAETLAMIVGGDIPKGNVLTTAQIAGTMAAKRTHDLIPFCHPLLLTGIDVTLEPDSSPLPSPGEKGSGDEGEQHVIRITATVRTTGRTGVEMEALTAVAVAGLTIYDMCKAVDRGMRIGEVRLLRKLGGKSGDIVLE